MATEKAPAMPSGQCLNPDDATAICGRESWLCSLGSGNSLSPANHSNYNQWSSLSSCMWKRADGSFLQVRYIALSCSTSGSSKTCSWLVSCFGRNLAFTLSTF